MQKEAEWNCQQSLEDSDIVANPLFLVLGNALGNPRYISDFLNRGQQRPCIIQVWLTCSLNLTQE